MGEFTLIQEKITELGWGKNIRLVPNDVDDEFGTAYVIVMDTPGDMGMRGALRVQYVKNRMTFSVRVLNEDKALQRAQMRGTAHQGFLIQAYLSADKSQVIGMGFVKTLELANMMKDHASEIRVLKCAADGNDFKIVYWGDLIKKWGAKTVQRYDFKEGKKDKPKTERWF